MTIVKWPLEGAYRRFLTWSEIKAIREGRAPTADVLPFPPKDDDADKPPENAGPAQPSR